MHSPDGVFSHAWKFAICALLLLDFTSVANAADCCPPRNCKELLDKGYRTSGVYKIHPFSASCSSSQSCVGNSQNAYPCSGVAVYCDMETDGGGWTVFQRRFDGAEEFYRDFATYEIGFGSAAEEYWLGLTCLHELTATSPQELRVDMSDFQGNASYAKYRQFYVADGIRGYKLKISGYHGNAGDSLTYHNGQKFSTFDHDQEAWAKNCAMEYHGAWWYKACHHSNPNGKYIGSDSPSDPAGVVWSLFNGFSSLQSIDFKIRPP